MVTTHPVVLLDAILVELNERLEELRIEETEKFDILDMGEGARVYSPIRITIDEWSDRTNEGIMAMNDTIEDLVVKSVNSMVKDGTRVEIPEAPEQKE